MPSWLALACHRAYVEIGEGHRALMARRAADGGALVAIILVQPRHRDEAFRDTRGAACRHWRRCAHEKSRMRLLYGSREYLAAPTTVLEPLAAPCLPQYPRAFFHEFAALFRVDAEGLHFARHEAAHEQQLDAAAANAIE